MPNWSESMERSFEYYVVDPVSWQDISLVKTITSCTITRDLSKETLGSATIDADDDLNDKYVRIYLITKQNGRRERFPLGTFLCQTSEVTYDGKRVYRSYDCYTPLIELKEKPLPIGFTAMKGENLLSKAVSLTKGGLRAPVEETSDTRKEMELTGDFVGESSDTYLTFITELLGVGKYVLDLDETGRVLFSPVQQLKALRPRFIYTDDNSSIIQPELQIGGELYNIPNVLEVIYSVPETAKTWFVTIENKDENSVVSIPNRGRRITRRDDNPNVVDGVTYDQLVDYAQNSMRELSTIKYEIKYKHGFCYDVRLGDCVRLEYGKSNLSMIDGGVNAKVIRQVIHCDAGCQVDETAVFTKELWGNT